jgi:hypothetical protein
MGLIMYCHLKYWHSYDYPASNAAENTMTVFVVAPEDCSVSMQHGHGAFAWSQNGHA